MIIHIDWKFPPPYHNPHLHNGNSIVLHTFIASPNPKLITHQKTKTSYRFNQICHQIFRQRFQWKITPPNIFDARSSAPVDMIHITLFAGSYTSLVVVWDFFHQQYVCHPSCWYHTWQKKRQKNPRCFTTTPPKRGIITPKALPPKSIGFWGFIRGMGLWKGVEPLNKPWSLCVFFRGKFLVRFGTILTLKQLCSFWGNCHLRSLPFDSGKSKMGWKIWKSSMRN